MAPATATSFNPGQAIHPSRASDEAPLDLEAIHDFAIDVILRAGVLLRKHTLLFASHSRRPPVISPVNVGASSSSASTLLERSEVKASQVDLVTQVDTLLEDFIRGEIEARWPTHRVVAEESFGKDPAVKQRWQRGRGPTWFIDPLDGTLNATHLFPLHCISIGFACSHTEEGTLIEDDALVGAIYAPSMGGTGSLWSGARGRGAYLSYPLLLPTSEEDRGLIRHGCHLAQLHQSSQQGVESASSIFPPAQRLPLVAQSLPANAPSGILFASEWGKDRRRGPNGQGNLSRKMNTMTAMAAKDWQPEGSVKQPDQQARYVHGVRSLGSSTLDLAFVAQGSLDMLWEGGCWEWDVCAGVALLLESGGLLTDSNPPVDPASSLWHGIDPLPRAQLGARRFLAVRGCTGTDDESAVEAQKRVARQVWSRTEGLDYRREGVLYSVEQSTAPTLQGEGAKKTTSSVRDWQREAMQERTRLSKEQAEALHQSQDPALAATDGAVFGGRLLDDSKDIWQHNAWDHVEPPASYLAMIGDKLAVQAQTKLSLDEATKYHARPADYWNDFYASHENRFFKDRRWLHLEFHELIAASKADAGPKRILEVGCGAGNTVFPLLEVNQNPQLELFACDYAPEAVNVVKSNPLYVSPPCGRCQASVWDLSATDAEGGPSLPEGIAPHSLDVVVLIFVLSALHPDEWQAAMANVRAMLKPGGLALVRDYGRHDLPQLRFGKGRMLDDNFYIRGDGTRVYFFTPQEFLTMFEATPPPSTEDSAESESGPTATATTRATSFETLQLAVDRRMMLNRKEKKQMFRNWLQAKFRYAPSNTS